MKVTLHLEGSRAEVLTQIAEFTTVLNTSLEAQPSAKTKAAKAAKPAAKPKKEEPVDEEEDDAGDDDGFEDDDSDDADTDSSDDDSDDGDDAEEEEDEAGDDITKEDVLKAFKNFSAKKAGNREKALKLLAKYKAEAVKDLKAKDYPAIMAALK